MAYIKWIVLFFIYAGLRYNAPEKWKESHMAGVYTLIIAIFYVVIQTLVSSVFLWLILWFILICVVIAAFSIKRDDLAKEQAQNQDEYQNYQTVQNEPDDEKEPEPQVQTEPEAKPEPVQETPVAEAVPDEKEKIQQAVEEIIKSHDLSTQAFYNPAVGSIFEKEKTTAEANLSKLREQLTTLAHFYRFDTTDKLTLAYEEIAKQIQVVKDLTKEINNYGTIALVDNFKIFNDFQKELYKSKIKTVYQGAEGEESIRDTLISQGIDANNILSDVNLKFEYDDSEMDEDSTHNNNQMDLVLVLKQGIFILEVKAYSTKHMKIFNNGRSDYGNNNFFEQMKHHSQALRAIVPEEFPIESVLVNANPETKITAPSNIKVWNTDEVYEKINGYRNRIADYQVEGLSEKIRNCSERHVQEEGLPERENEVFVANFMQTISGIDNYLVTLQEVRNLIKSERGYKG